MKIKTLLKKIVNNIFLSENKDRDIIICLIVFYALSIIPQSIISHGSVLFLFIGLINFLIANGFHDICDKLRFHYAISIFYNGINSYWRCDWKRKYEWSGDRIIGHKKFTIPWLNIKIDVPAFWFDAWHIMKIFLFWSNQNSIWYIFLFANRFPEYYPGKYN